MARLGFPINANDFSGLEIDKPFGVYRELLLDRHRELPRAGIWGATAQPFSQGAKLEATGIATNPYLARRSICRRKAKSNAPVSQ